MILASLLSNLTVLQSIPGEGGETGAVADRQGGVRGGGRSGAGAGNQAGKTI